MRVGGSEAHIKIGLADLFITAAPILQLLAEKDIQFTPQCMLYLIEGMDVAMSCLLHTAFHRE